MDIKLFKYLTFHVFINTKKKKKDVNFTFKYVIQFHTHSFSFILSFITDFHGS